MELTSRLIVGFNWPYHLWRFQARGRFIAKQWEVQCGPLIVSWWDKRGGE